MRRFAGVATTWEYGTRVFLHYTSCTELSYNLQLSRGEAFSFSFALINLGMRTLFSIHVRNVYDFPTPEEESTWQLL
ncbi:MAG TPA: hypothetical protein VEI49_14330 [Terriglobales bacterium]|nr:hypothetical protein [Terriglobales bacterium]